VGRQVLEGPEGKERAEVFSRDVAGSGPVLGGGGVVVCGGGCVGLVCFCGGWGGVWGGLFLGGWGGGVGGVLLFPPASAVCAKS